MASVEKICKGKSTLVIHDGDHSKRQVLKDLKAYADLVSMSSYFIVEDGIIDLFHPSETIGSYQEGPLAAIEEFLTKDNRFEIDEARERYILTYNPKGYLKRVR